MEAIRKQASKLREQVARQQQRPTGSNCRINSSNLSAISLGPGTGELKSCRVAGYTAKSSWELFAVLKQLGGRYGHDSALADEAELQCYEELRTLFRSTRAAKHFQRDIVRGVEGFSSVSSKQMGIVTKLAEDCCKYGNEYQDSGFALAKASLDFGTSHISVEKEMDNLLRILGDKVFDPLRTMITAAPLDDARHLTHRYERIRRDVQAQTMQLNFKMRNQDCLNLKLFFLHWGEKQLPL